MAARSEMSDVLCEAMEYLLKLATNLRTRTEMLKEKKIRKDKLKNSLAIQKAARRVKLICELSKKSIENVENGLQNILSTLNVLSQTEGGKNVHSQKFDTSRFQYFECGQYKLKVSKSVPVKHFMSVKVLTSPLPKLMMVNYPHDPKFHAKKLRTEGNIQWHFDMKNGSGLSFTEVTSSSNSYKDIIELETVKEKDVEQRVKVLSELIENKAQRTGYVSTDIEINNISKEITEDKGNQINQNHSKQNYLENKEDSRSDSGKKKHRESTNDKLDDENTTQQIDQGQQKFNENCGIDDESNITTKDYENVGNKMETQCDNDIEVRSNHSQSGQPAANSSKPLIKCVSLDKLLKPETLADRKEISKSKWILDGKGSSQYVKNTETYDEYWTRKRNEISNFKPKLFSIKVVRLSESVHYQRYLKSYGLKRITHSGVVLYENQECVNNDKIKSAVENKYYKRVKRSLMNDSDSDEIGSCTKTQAGEPGNIMVGSSEHGIVEPTTEKICKNSNADTQSAKNYLLHDSDSDAPDTRKITKSRNSNHSLVDKSESKEGQEIANVEPLIESNESANLDKNESIKNLLLNKSDSEEDTSQEKQSKMNQNDSNDISEKSKTVSDDSTLNVDKSLKSNDEASITVNESTLKQKNNLSKEVNETSNSKEVLFSNPDKSNISENELEIEKKIKDPNMLTESESNKDPKETGTVDTKDNSSEYSLGKETTENKQKWDLQSFVQPEVTKVKDSTNNSDVNNSSASSGNKSELDSNKKRESANFKDHRKKIKTKRKSYMESIEAKKMLLIHSSSSDTDDDLLKSALNDIKKSVFKDITEDEDITSKTTYRKKTRKKINNSDSDSSKKEKNHRNKHNSKTNEKCSNNSSSDHAKQSDDSSHHASGTQSNASSSKVRH